MYLWTHEKVVQLILEFRARPFFWDVTHEHYKNKYQKQAALQEMAELFSATVDDVEKKWKVLKIQFRREHVAFCKRRASGALPEKVKWFGYELMLFLLHAKGLNEGGEWKIRPPVKCDIDDVISIEDTEDDILSTDHYIRSNDGTGNTKLIGVPHRKLSKNKMLCENHFSARDILPSGRLMRGAVPDCYDSPEDSPPSSCEPISIKHKVTQKCYGVPRRLSETSQSTSSSEPSINDQTQSDAVPKGSGVLPEAPSQPAISDLQNEVVPKPPSVLSEATTSAPTQSVTSDRLLNDAIPKRSGVPLGATPPTCHKQPLASDRLLNVAVSKSSHVLLETSPSNSQDRPVTSNRLVKYAVAQTQTTFPNQPAISGLLTNSVPKSSSVLLNAAPSTITSQPIIAGRLQDKVPKYFSIIQESASSTSPSQSVINVRLLNDEVPKRSGVAPEATLSTSQSESKAQKRKLEDTDVYIIKRVPERVVEDLEMAVEERVSVSSTHAQTTEPWPETDACAAYGVVVADRLRQLGPRERAMAQNQIDNLLFELIMQNTQLDQRPPHPVTLTRLQESALPQPVKVEHELDENLFL